VFTVSNSVLDGFMCNPLTPVYLLYMSRMPFTSSAARALSVCRWSSAYAEGWKKVPDSS